MSKAPAPDNNSDGDNGRRASHLLDKLFHKKQDSSTSSSKGNSVSEVKGSNEPSVASESGKPHNQYQDNQDTVEIQPRGQSTGEKVIIGSNAQAVDGSRSQSESQLRSPPQSQAPAQQAPQDDSEGYFPVSYKLSYSVGVSENKNSKYRSTMEDVHTYVANFVERLDWGYFAIFDGHAGKPCAKWCGQNLHLLLEKELLNNEQQRTGSIPDNSTQAGIAQSSNANSEGAAGTQSDDNGAAAAGDTNDKDIRDCLDKCFQQADQLIIQSSNNIGSSGCTAAVAIVRWELDEKYQDDVHLATANNYKGNDFLPSNENSNNNNSNSNKSSGQDQDQEASNTRKSQSGINRKSYINNNVNEMHQLFDFVPSKHHKRMLYTANVGDSRLVLCRSGYAIRLSYDHKCSDINESNRIVQSGGLIMKNRVNGVLAVTRSLGDLYLKNLIIGRPYTTAIEINEHDEFLILACDGLWDIVSDQEAVDLIRHELDPNKQAKILVDHAMKNLSTDNITVMVIRFDKRIFGSDEFASSSYQ